MTYNEILDKEIIKKRIETNLLNWEKSLSKHKGCKYNKKLDAFVSARRPLRVSVFKNSPEKNEQVGYSLVKHLINRGVAPSKICVTTLENSYSSIRGFSEMREIKEKIFSPQNEVILIENCRYSEADVKDNMENFWIQMSNHLKLNPKINLILCWDNESSVRRTEIKAPGYNQIEIKVI